MPLSPNAPAEIRNWSVILDHKHAIGKMRLPLRPFLFSALGSTHYISRSVLGAFVYGWQVIFYTEASLPGGEWGPKFSKSSTYQAACLEEGNKGTEQANGGPNCAQGAQG